jgi:hypothetical protein
MIKFLIGFFVVSILATIGLCTLINLSKLRLSKEYRSQVRHDNNEYTTEDSDANNS